MKGSAKISYTLDAEYRDMTAESVYEYGARAGHLACLEIPRRVRLKVSFFVSRRSRREESRGRR
jgi:hypothetical protein